MAAASCSTVLACAASSSASVAARRGGGQRHHQCRLTKLRTRANGVVVEGGSTMKTTMMVRATSSSSSSTLVRPGDDRRRHRRHSPTTRVRALVDSEQEASPSSTTAADNLPQADDIVPAAVEAFLQRKGRHAMFKAAKGGSIDVDELPGGRSLMEYMSLPASQYSTLDGEKVERIGDDTFKCTLGSFEFFGFRLQPILTARVDVKPGGAGCVIRVVAAEIHGSGLVEDINDMFEIDSVNRVGWSERCNPGTGQCEIISETLVSVYLLVPRWFPFTIKATERTGNFVVGQVVNQVVPRFLKQLKTDYETWAGGDDSREATGNLFDDEIGLEEDEEGGADVEKA